MVPYAQNGRVGVLRHLFLLEAAGPSAKLEQGQADKIHAGLILGHQYGVDPPNNSKPCEAAPAIEDRSPLRTHWL